MKLSLADQAYQIIKRDIINCSLEPGAQVAQSQLVETYKLGITPIREALKRLEMEGLVQSIPRYGYLISPITIEDVRSIYELRLILEKPAIRLAAERATDDQLKSLHDNARFTYRYKDPQSYQEFLENNAIFHSSIAETAGNDRLAAAIKKLLDEMNRIFQLGLELKDSAAEMREEHVDLMDALIKRDADWAERITEEQILRSQERVLEMLNQQGYVKTLTTFSKK